MTVGRFQMLLFLSKRPRSSLKRRAAVTKISPGKCKATMMSLDHLWNFHEELAAVLSRKIVAEKCRLDERLHKLGGERFQRIRKFFPSIEIRKSLRRPGPAVANNLAG